MFVIPSPLPQVADDKIQDGTRIPTLLARFRVYAFLEDRRSSFPEIVIYIDSYCWPFQWTHDCEKEMQKPIREKGS